MTFWRFAFNYEKAILDVLNLCLASHLILPPPINHAIVLDLSLSTNMQPGSHRYLYFGIANEFQYTSKQNAIH